jgi:hypothetical protein
MQAWQRPTLAGGKPPTTIGAEELNFRVRDGNGCDLFAIATRLVELVRSKLDKTIMRNRFVFLTLSQIRVNQTL